MSDFLPYILTAFALVFVIEGMLYAVFPDTMRRIMAMAAVMPAQSLRKYGASMVLCGFGLVYMIDLFSR